MKEAPAHHHAPDQETRVAGTAAAATHELRIEPAGWVVRVTADQTLLRAAQRSGVRLPRSCQNGSCRACTVRLLAGQVQWRVEWPGLSAEERAAGDILTCVVEPRSDLVILAPDAGR